MDPNGSGFDKVRAVARQMIHDHGELAEAWAQEFVKQFAGISPRHSDIWIEIAAEIRKVQGRSKPE